MGNKTVFVIGAGASEEANLPTGNELKMQISNLLNFHIEFNKLLSGDWIIAEALNILVRELDEKSKSSSLSSYINKALHIRNALPQAISIDNFIG